MTIIQNIKRPSENISDGLSVSLNRPDCQFEIFSNGLSSLSRRPRASGRVRRRRKGRLRVQFGFV